MIRKKRKSHSKSVQIIPVISDSKWHEIEEREERDNLILDIREEIINTSLEICYSRYLTRQVIKFAVHCCYHAWGKIIDLYFLGHDNCALDNTWDPDVDVPPCQADTWQSNTVKILEEKHVVPEHQETRTEISFTSEANIEIAPSWEMKAPSSQRALPPPVNQDFESTVEKVESQVTLKSTAVLPDVKQVIAEARPRYSLKHHGTRTSSFNPIYISPANLPPTRIEVAYSIGSARDTKSGGSNTNIRM